MELRKITFRNVSEIAALSVREDQQEFVAPNWLSLGEAYVVLSDGAWARAFGLYEGDEPVGFAMFGYGPLPEEPEDVQGSYSLWRFMIDQKYQGRGLGKQAMQVCLGYLSTHPFRPAEKVWLSYDPENQAARALYHKFGFRENGRMCGKEIVAERTL